LNESTKMRGASVRCPGKKLLVKWVGKHEECSWSRGSEKREKEKKNTKSAKGPRGVTRGRTHVAIHVSNPEPRRGWLSTYARHGVLVGGFDMQERTRHERL